MDKNMVQSYLCDNSSESLLLTAACSTGTVNMLLDWISPDMVAQQVGSNPTESSAAIRNV